MIEQAANRAFGVEVCRGRRRSAIGFTLVELLVVIAVLAVLAGLLAPVLGRGKSSAQRLKCVGDLRQLGLAAQMYWDDNRGKCFPYGGASTDGGALYWFGWMGSGAEGQRAFDASRGALYPYLQGRGVEICPSLDYALAQFKLKATGAAYGYGYNLSLSAPLRQRPIDVSQLRRPTETALLADAAQINTWQAPASPAHPMIEEWYFIDDSTTQPNGHFRHERRAEVLFCDGHVGQEKPVPHSIDARLPEARVGQLRHEILAGP